MTEQPALDAEPRFISRRTMIRTAAWSAPVIALAVASPAATASVTVNAASGGNLDALVITSRGGNVQYGSNWGTTGRDQFQISLENADRFNPSGTLAIITVVLHYVGPGTSASTLVASAVHVPSGSPWSDSSFQWTVPGYVAGVQNVFFFTVSANGFKTVTSEAFSIFMP